ncbi:hypothetical protein QQX98_009883 [Neonectria punicea]|uniref:BZIP domain-containing protein n=1 Tax=Neonectria punicea TaxID=979145 RepID=A0ABR1GRF9_9HYPO
MAGEKQSESSTSSSAIRIRDNQRRSRARHKEYVEGLQRKLQDFERRGVEATLEMQQAARNVALENSRLRMLLGYHNVSTEEIDKFLQAFPDQSATEAAKATISQSVAGQPAIASAAPKIPLMPMSRPPSTGPVNPTYVAPPLAKESSTREVLDAIVGIKRETRISDISSPHLPQPVIPTELRQPLLQPRPQPPTLPALSALVLGQTRPSHNHVDRLSVLASASMQQDAGDGNHHRIPTGADSLKVPSPPIVGQSPPSSNAGTPGRLSSASPRSQDRRSRSPFDTSTVNRGIADVQGNVDTESTKASLGYEGHEDGVLKKSKISRVLQNRP